MAENIQVQSTKNASGLFAALQSSRREIQAFGHQAEGISGGLAESFGGLGSKISFATLDPILAGIAAIGGSVFSAFEPMKSSTEHVTYFGDELAKALQKAETTVETPFAPDPPDPPED